MTDLATLGDRSARLLETTGFITLATVSAEGYAWASTVNYVPAWSPLTLTWYSSRFSRHSRNIAHNPYIAGSIFRTDLGEAAPPVGLDGVQLQGRCHEVAQADLDDVYEYYYRTNFPEPEVRREWELPKEQFYQAGHRRFYQLVIEHLWLVDLDRWAQDKEDGRIEVPLEALAAR